MALETGVLNDKQPNSVPTVPDLQVGEQVDDRVDLVQDEQHTKHHPDELELQD